MASKGTIEILIAANFPMPTKILPVKSPNLVINVSIKTVDLYLSFLPSWLYIIY